MFMKQVLSPDKSCKNTVNNAISQQTCDETEVSISGNTGAYCKARQRLPGETIEQLLTTSNALSLEMTAENWKAFGRQLKVVDGTMVKMADTTLNQDAYPQHTNQKTGLGFPLARLVAVISVSTGTVVGYSIGANKGKGTGEASLLRNIFNHCIENQDILLGDRYYPSYFLMADLLKKGADGIFRGQSQRHYDFRTGNRLGKKDHVVVWKKPQKPEWMSQEDYEIYAETIQIREFKTGGNVYVTTLLDDKQYSKWTLAETYKRRWDIEIDLRSIKEVMKMDMLSCKTPEMVKKEIGIHFLAYNFIRILMVQACLKHKKLPWQVSFKGTIQTLNNFSPHFLHVTIEKWQTLYEKMLYLIANNIIGNRPGRVEPRAVKQRPKPFLRLNKPRNIEKKRLMNKVTKRVLKDPDA